MVSAEPHRPIHDRRNDVPAGLVGIVDRCLEKTPDLRYPSARALSDALAPFETDRIPSSATPVPLTASGSLERAVTRARTTQEWSDHDRRPPRSGRRALALIVGVLLLGAAASWYALRSPDAGDTESYARTEPDDGPVALAGDSGETERSPTGASPAVTAETEGATDSKPQEASGGALVQPSGGAEPEGGAQGEGETDATPAGGSETGTTPPTESATSAAAAASASGGDDVDAGDDGATRPRAPDVGSSDPAPDPRTDDGGAPPPDPAGVIRFGPLVTPKNPGPTGSHSEARKYCEGLASIRHLGIGGWKLATPSTAAKLVGNKQIKRTSYWTSARWKGKVLVVKLPSGSKSSVKAERSAARPLCVAKWP